MPTFLPPSSKYAPSLLILLWLILVYWTFQLLRPSDQQLPWIFLDNLNLLIHEAGHWIFSLFGQFIAILGGSLNQCLLPAIFLGYFIFKRDVAGSSFGLFWLGDNLINVSYYIADAQAMALPLLGGDSSIHDWNWLLTYLGWINQAELLGGIVKVFGVITVLSAIGLLTLTIILQWTTAKQQPPIIIRA